MMSEDMTYCVANCKTKATCYRNPKRIKQHNIPHSYSDFSKVCMGYEQEDEVKESELEKEFSVKGFGNEMRRIERNNDAETAHVLADDLMCKLLRKLGYGEGVDIFEKMDKWYS